MFSDPVYRLRSLFKRTVVESEMDDELRFHFDQQVEKYMASGLAREEAMRQARLIFGGDDKIKEDCRDSRGVGIIEDFSHDLSYAARMLRKNPLFTIVVVLTLALGMGATTAIFSVINSILLRPLPYKDPSSLVMIWERNPHQKNKPNVVAPPNFLDWKSQSTAFTDMAALADGRTNLTGNGDPEQLVAQYVTPNFFSVLGVQPILGSGFTPENGEKGKDDVVILSYGLWQDRFAADHAIIGKSIFLDGKPQTVVGVAPKGFGFFIKQGSLTGAAPQLWAPWVFPKTFSDRKEVGRFLTVVARLKPGVTRGRAQDQMNTIAARLAAEYPDFDSNWTTSVVPIREQLSGDLRPALLTLFCAVAFVLLIACANVSSLLLARAAQREKEMAIRNAIGASRWRIARQLLTESFLLAIIGGVLGLALALGGTNALLAATPANPLDLRSVSIDLPLLAFAALATLLSSVLFGFLPSYIASNSVKTESLKEESRTATAGRHRAALRSALVVGQLGLALVLLAGAGLMIRSFVRLIGVDPGFETKNLLTFQISLPQSKYPKDEAQMAFFQQLLPRVARLPGVRSVTMENFPPLAGQGAATGVHILGQPLVEMSNLPVAGVRVVGPDYFKTMGIPLHAGRFFDAVELNEMRHVVIVNQAFVDKYLAGENPLGRRAVIYMKSLEESNNQPSEIVGVVGDVRQMGLGSAADPTVYWPMPELPYSRMTILVRTSGDPMGVVSAARNELRQMDAELPMSSVVTMDQLLADSLSRSRFTMFLLGLFAALALVLTAVGIYGVIAYSVAQRTHEIGVRMALGAQRRDVLGLVLGQGTRLTFIGVVLGIVAGLALTHLMGSLLYGISAHDPLTFAAVSLLLMAVAFLASYIPAFNATRVDPTVALRYE